MNEQLYPALREALGADLSQKEREAVVDLALWAMYVDGSLKLEETTAIYTLENEASWESGIPLGQYVRSSLPLVRDALSDSAARERLLGGIADRLRTSRARSLAFAAAREMIGVDGTVGGREAEWLSSVAARLDVE